MGTRGLKIYRFRGKYYIFYNQFDSYPEGLGRSIVANIPTDPEAYRVWLEEQKSRLAQWSQSLEDNFLTITDPSAQDYSIVNRLEQLPSPLPEISGSIYIEWTYIINLDHEIFSVNHGAHFKLNNIPRDNDLWMKALKLDVFDRITLSTDICPAESIACPIRGIRPDKRLLRKNLREFAKMSRSLVQQKKYLDPCHVGIHGQVFLSLALIAMFEQYYSSITSFASEWSPGDFVFREFIFAVISLAAGQARFYSRPLDTCNPGFCFDESHDHSSSGYLDVPDEKYRTCESNILPEFVQGSHQPGTQPGSAPLESTYWFEGVLVFITTGLDEEDLFKASVAQVVTIGLEQGKLSFQAVAISAFHYVLVEVRMEDKRPVVRHTELEMLSPIAKEDLLSTHPRERPPIEKGQNKRPLRGSCLLTSGIAFKSFTKLQKYFPGIISLVNFFDTAANRRLASFSGKRSRLPAEIYYQIIDFTDDSTYLVCSNVCQSFREYCQKKFRLDGMSILSKHKDDMGFTCVNQSTGAEMDLFPFHFRGDSICFEHNWSPIVGSERPSILNDVVLNFRTSREWPSTFK